MFFLIALLSFSLSLWFVGFVKQRYSNLLLDIPNERSSHKQPTPRGGGVGFVLAFLVSTILALIASDFYPTWAKVPFTPIEFTQLWLVLIPIALVGLLDDRYNLPAASRYTVQLSVAVLAVNFFGEFPQPWFLVLGHTGQILSMILTVLGITAIINFYNFMDGLDGLVASVTTVQLFFLCFYLNQPIYLLLAAALGGFLYWNWSPAKIFMGDIGSTVLGAVVAVSLLSCHAESVTCWGALTITLPLITDAIYTLLRRLFRQENIFQSHRSHIYQRLQQAGWTHSQVCLIYAGVTFLNAVSLWSLPFLWSALIAVLVCTTAIVAAEVYLQQQKQKITTNLPDNSNC